MIHVWNELFQCKFVFKFFFSMQGCQECFRVKAFHKAFDMWI
jgi:hypothetical protein